MCEFPRFCTLIKSLRVGMTDSHAEGPRANGDGGGHGIGRRVDHRHDVGALVRNVGVLRESLCAAENANRGEGCGREQPANAKLHGVSPQCGGLDLPPSTSR
jgi:hypothetical protein